MLRIANSSVNSNNHAEGKEPSAECVQDSIIEEPMVIQQEPGGVEAFMHSMSADEKKRNDTTSNMEQSKNNSSIFRPFVTSSADKTPIREQSPPVNSGSGYTVLNNEKTTQQVKFNQNKQTNAQNQQERLSRSVIRGVRRSQSVSVSRENADENANLRSKQEKPPSKNSQQSINTAQTSQTFTMSLTILSPWRGGKS